MVRSFEMSEREIGGNIA